ncbi:hypothetical protein ACTNDY_06450 [Tissierellaceae bacterium HCP3S3_D8]
MYKKLINNNVLKLTGFTIIVFLLASFVFNYQYINAAGNRTNDLVSDDGLAIECESEVFENNLVEAERYNKLIEDLIKEEVIFKDYRELNELEKKNKNIVPTITIKDTIFYSSKVIENIVGKDLIVGGMMDKLDDETEQIVEQSWFDRRRRDTGDYIILNIISIEDDETLEEIDQYQRLAKEYR